jgi:hypothetical protein
MHRHGSAVCEPHCPQAGVCCLPPYLVPRPTGASRLCSSPPPLNRCRAPRSLPPASPSATSSPRWRSTASARTQRWPTTYRSRWRGGLSAISRPACRLRENRASPHCLADALAVLNREGILQREHRCAPLPGRPVPARLPRS